MGRSAGWLAYGAAIAGEASLVISVEDITGKYRGHAKRSSMPTTGEKTTRAIMNVEEVVKRIVATMRVREEAEGKEFGVIVMAEGLAEYLPDELPARRAPRRARAHRHRRKLNLSRLFAELVAERVHSADRPQAARSPACNWATKPAAPSRTPST